MAAGTRRHRRPGWGRRDHPRDPPWRGGDRGDARVPAPPHPAPRPRARAGHRRRHPRGKRPRDHARACPTARSHPLTLLVRTGLLYTGDREIESGWLLERDGLIAEVGSGSPPPADEVINASNCVAVPGLVNAHDHLYQWATRGYAPNGTLFESLRALYPAWPR